MIGFVTKTARERAQVALCEFKGRSYLDLRTHYTTDGGETFSPSGKGCTVRPDQIGDLIRLLQSAQAEAAAKALIPSREADHG